MSNLSQFDQVMGGAMQAFNIDKRLSESRLMAAWSEIVGEQVAAQTKVMNFRYGTLVVAVRSASWTQQLSFMRDDIIQKYTKQFGRGILRDIRFQQTGYSSPEEPSPSEKEKPQSPKISASAQTLTQGDLDRISERVQSIEDLELREKVARFLTSTLVRERAMREAGWRRCTGCSTYYNAEESCPICACQQRYRTSMLEAQAGQNPREN